MAAYPAKYDVIFKNIIKKEPKDAKQALELLVQNSYFEKIQMLTMAMESKEHPLPQIKQIYELFPEFQDYGGYVNGANNYIASISKEIDNYNFEQDSGARPEKLDKISKLMKLLSSHVKDYPINGGK